MVNSSGSYSEQVLYSFTGSGGDGSGPSYGELIRDTAGNLYGTTVGGGTSSYGTVFELVNSSGSYTEQVLHSFIFSDGAYPYAGLIMDTAGNLFGTTSQGGAHFAGNVFELVNSSGSYSYQVLHSFVSNGTDGYYPYSGLIMDTGGNLYGTTNSGGAQGAGTVFELVSSSGSYSEQVLYSFTGSGGDGSGPSFGGLIMDTVGNLYGTTLDGGASGDGTVFELVNSSGTYTEQVLDSFTGSSGDGASPYGGVIIDSAGNLYGTTQGGGTYGSGTVFELVIVPPGTTYSTTTTLTSSLNPATAGDSVTLSATVTPSFPGLVMAGTVTFLEGSTILGTSSIGSGGRAAANGGGPANVPGSITVDSTAIGIGSYTITAQFTPSASYVTGSSGMLTQTVNETGVALTDGNNAYTGNQTINGTVSATTFTGSGAGLTNVTAAGLACAGCVTNFQLGINYAGSASQGGAATNALLLGGLSASSFASVGSNSFIGDQTISGNLSATGLLTAAAINSTGTFSTAGLALPAGGTATAAQGFNSGALDSSASLFSSTAGAAQNMLFRWQAEPVASSNNTAAPLATLNLLYGSDATPTETGLSVNHDGTIHFASGQTFPGASGGGIAGVTAGAGLSGGGTTGTITLSIPASGVTNTMLANPSLTVNAGTGLSGGGSVSLGGSTTLSLASNACAPGSALTALPFTCSAFATSGSNAFSGNQSVAGTVTATAFSGNGSGLTGVNAATAATAASATNATTALSATNALNLGGLAPSSYASIGANTFTGTQTMPNVTVSGVVQGGSLKIGGGTAITEYVSVTDNITLPVIPNGSCTTFTTVAVTGFTPGTSDSLALGIPSGMLSGVGGGVFLIYQAWETSTAASPTVTIQVCNVSGTKYKGGNSGTVRIDIFKH